MIDLDYQAGERVIRAGDEPVADESFGVVLTLMTNEDREARSDFEAEVARMSAEALDG